MRPLPPISPSPIERTAWPRRLLSGAARAGAATWLLLALATAACSKAQPATRGGPPPVPVLAAKVERKAVPVSFRAIGHVEAIETVGIKARAGGELEKVWFEEGKTVHAGDALFSIDPRQYQASLDQATAILARDQALLAKAEEDTKRYASLVEKDFVTKEQFAQITATAAALRAAVAGDQASIETAKLNLSYCSITAPVTGRTGNLMVKVGNLIKANDDKPMVTINQTTPIYVSFSVPAQMLPAIRQGREGSIAVEAAAPEAADSPSTGVLTFVDNAVDTATSTILLKGTFPNRDEKLWPGEFVDVRVILGEEADRVVCPAPAVQTGQQGQYVFVVKDDSTVEMRPVKVARMDEREAVVDSGLVGGEMVVTDGQLRLVPGATVALKEAGAQGSPRS
jgi:membrane fusion protein, multidrug efflux system